MTTERDALNVQPLDLTIARARIVLSILAMVSLYVDPSTAGGLFHLSRYALVTLLSHFLYSLVIYYALKFRAGGDILTAVSTLLDLSFAATVAYLTEGATSPSYVFFVFAIIAAGTRTGMRSTVAITLSSVTLYLAVIAVCDGITSTYMMRAAYLGIAGYLIGFFGQQRAAFEMQLREMKARADRESIARSLHDGYVQALAGVNLRLETCRELLRRDRPADALAEIVELQTGVAREYDAVRNYIRSLAGIRRASASNGCHSDPRLIVRATFNTSAQTGEHILQIMLEGLRNARRHAKATAVKIAVDQSDGKTAVTIDDDGVGFPEPVPSPWAIASRVAELEGILTVNGDGVTRVAIELPNEQ